MPDQTCNHGANHNPNTGHMEEPEEETLGDKIRIDRRKSFTLANIGLFVTIIFTSGINYNKVSVLETEVATLRQRVNVVDTISSIRTQLDNIQSEVGRVRDKVDRLEVTVAAKSGVWDKWDKKWDK